MPIVYNPFYSLAGVLVGLLVGLTGVGGGSLMTPLLVLVFGFHPVTAVGTDLLYASATKTVGTAVHGWRGTVDWRVVGRLAAGSVPTTVAMLFALSYATHRSADTGHLVATILGAVLLLTAGAILSGGSATGGSAGSPCCSARSSARSSRSPRSAPGRWGSPRCWCSIPGWS